MHRGSRAHRSLPAAARRMWRWIRERAERQPVNAAGVLFTAAVLMVGTVALASANNLLFLILAAMLSTLLVSGFVSRLSLAGLELDFGLPEHISAGRKFAGRVRVRNAKRWLPSFSVHLGGSNENVLTTLYFPVIPGGALLEETVEVLFHKRGIYSENGFRLSTGFPFGFLERRAHVPVHGDLLVYPSVDPQPGFEDLLASVRGELESQLRGAGQDFYRIRPYEALESARNVDWKATAHSGELQVREFARERDRILDLYLDLDVPAELHAWFESAVNACAYLVWHVGGRGGRMHFRTQEFDISIPEMGDAYTILKYLATVTPRTAYRPAFRIRRAGGTTNQPGPSVPNFGPQDEDSYQVVFTAGDPEAVAEAGWVQARVVGPGAFPAPALAGPASRAR